MNDDYDDKLSRRTIFLPSRYGLFSFVISFLIVKKVFEVGNETLLKVDSKHVQAVILSVKAAEVIISPSPSALGTPKKINQTKRNRAKQNKRTFPIEVEVSNA